MTSSAPESNNNEKLLGHAQECKTAGNASYSNADYDAAIASYTDGLEWLIDPPVAAPADADADASTPDAPTTSASDSPLAEPVAPVAGSPTASSEAAGAAPSDASADVSPPDDSSTSPDSPAASDRRRRPPPPDKAALERQRQAARFRPAFRPLAAVLLSNRAACHLQQQKYEETKADCDLSLELDPKYAKALLRRAKANEALTKLSDALADYQAALALDSSLSEAREAVRTLPPRIKEQQEREKEEMIGKLKELGNSVLGWFGLSTDNFKFVQDPNTGGYSVNFQQNAAGGK